jgi:hypothetical protein
MLELIQGLIAIFSLATIKTRKKHFMGLPMGIAYTRIRASQILGVVELA